jgi:hypothetical protein
MDGLTEQKMRMSEQLKWNYKAKKQEKTAAE